ncbi:hypothetical protein KIH74_22540 [Kineosporia sp. J2-2]|uniref:C2H2-type domain-containing protein n=1 Tax=Kineosporia corallincola TaxID=2835133 RepID=A0ABS5TKV9_9ACTN|nr:hypothetical protein [Kineosporia corallincola]MBT0771736.1 hypothetical protein [Kineosporia corallincola]
MDTTQPDDGSVRIDVGLSLSQITFSCNVCGCAFSLGDIEDELHSHTSYDDCPLDEDDDYDPEDDDADLAYEGM